MGYIYTKLQPQQPPEPSFPYTLPEDALLLQWFLIPATKAIHRAPAHKFHSVPISKTPILPRRSRLSLLLRYVFHRLFLGKRFETPRFNSADYSWSGNKKHSDTEASHFTLRKKRGKVLFSVHWHFCSLAMTHRRAAAARSPKALWRIELKLWMAADASDKSILARDGFGRSCRWYYQLE